MLLVAIYLTLWFGSIKSQKIYLGCNSAQRALTAVIYDNPKAICAQKQTKKKLEKIARQHFQAFSCGSYDRKLLSMVLWRSIPKVCTSINHLIKNLVNF